MNNHLKKSSMAVMALLLAINCGQGLQKDFIPAEESSQNPGTIQQRLDGWSVSLTPAALGCDYEDSLYTCWPNRTVTLTATANSSLTGSGMYLSIWQLSSTGELLSMLASTSSGTTLTTTTLKAADWQIHTYRAFVSTSLTPPYLGTHYADSPAQRIK
ncbi:MAG: hypothetical protein HY901_14660, partial [Deltaproteobacteria bacterium]|nr:hypothetical protein [Deltaproteobacteria bacterium]